MLTYRVTQNRIEIDCSLPNAAQRGPLCLFVAVNTDPAEGSAVVPFGRHAEGSTVFLPFCANRLYSIAFGSGGLVKRVRVWLQTIWGAVQDSPAELDVNLATDQIRVSLPLVSAGSGAKPRVTVYLKQMDANDGWGWMLPCPEMGIAAGTDDQFVRRFAEIDPATGVISLRDRLRPERIRIYQLLPRLFGNTSETRKPNGTLAENGVGKFADLNDTALRELRDMGFTHLWLTGVLQQVTATDYSAVGEPADDPDLLKGLAGSPYAIKDYFDVCPDYAVEPAKRLAEFKALLARIHGHGLKAIIDFVPNHVARSYYSSVRPELSFGASDDRRHFFIPRNNFFYLRPEDAGGGAPLLLPTMSDGHPTSPTCQVLGTCDGRYEGELEFGRVTGNNAVTWRPGQCDWYETVKLNYGYDFTTGAREYGHGEQCGKECPDTWRKMDAILAYWQEMGVDGFRCDMAHMVPPEFWSWALGKARARHPEVLFVAEAYDNDPAKVRSGNPVLQALNGGCGNVMYDLLSAGFDAVYDDPSYKTLKAMYDGCAWANDLDGSFPHPYIFHNSLRYAENHDEVRLASREWGGVGMMVGRAVSAILFGIGRGPVMVYHGQEVGEPAQGAAGFCGDNARTTIFDYWSMPEFTKWVNGHRYDGGRLSSDQKGLRAFYARLLNLVGEPAFRDGEFFPLNAENNENEQGGRLPGEQASGHWLYSFVRSSGREGHHYLVATNLHPSETLRDVRIRLSGRALEFMGWDAGHGARLTEKLTGDGTVLTMRPEESPLGVTIPAIPPLMALYFEIQIGSAT